MNMSYLFMKLRDFINLNYLDWWYLSANPSPAAVHLLEQNLDKVLWTNLCENPAAIHILEQHPDKIDWHWLSNNLHLFLFVSLINELLLDCLINKTNQFYLDVVLKYESLLDFHIN